ncbi:MAG TPA: hypothetical protein PLQ59_08040 [Fervidobacterium sp.]|nr:hypothetical protein [Fervidobacterium sp.]
MVEKNFIDRLCTILSEEVDRKDFSLLKARESIRDLVGNVSIDCVVSKMSDYFVITSCEKRTIDKSFCSFISLIVAFPDEVPSITNAAFEKKEFLRFILLGLKKFLKSKYKDLKYEFRRVPEKEVSSLESAKNMSSVIQSNGFLVAILRFLQNLYLIDKRTAIDLVENDVNNIIATAFIMESYYLEKETLEHFINCEDEYRRAAAFLGILGDLSVLDFPNKTQSRLPVAKITKTLDSMAFEYRVQLIVELCLYNGFSDKSLLTYCAKDLVLTMKFISRIVGEEEPNIYHLSKLLPILDQLSIYKEILTYFSDAFVKWVFVDGSEYSWASEKGKILDFMAKKNVRKSIVEELEKRKKELFTSEFDRQVRYSRYLVDSKKLEIIESICRNQ